MYFPFKAKSPQVIWSLLIFLFLSFPLSITLANPVSTQKPPDGQETSQKKEEEKLARAKTEEIVVTASLLEEKTLATVSVIKPTVLELFKTKNISEVLSFASGTYVTIGTKAEARVKIRGLDSDRSTLLVDGLPVYEPYFNLYDLKTIPSPDVEYVRVTKGSSSVLYGPNTMGGIIEVLTRRPQENCLELRTRMGPTSSFSFSGSGTYATPKFAMKLYASHEESDGYRIKESGTTSLLANSDYRVNSFNGKVYFFPGQKSEILFQASFYDSAYGVPTATAYYSPRYWRFKDWERLILGVGGTFSIFKTGTLKVRTYRINYYNILDAYKDPNFSSLSWESIYKNYSAGAFILGTVHPGSRHELRFSLNGRMDNVNLQASATSFWEKYEHRVYSFGLEDEWKLAAKLHLIGGFSLDHLQKQTGRGKTTLNPVIGLRLLPVRYLEFHLSYSQKSRFPSMRSLYSSVGGNPDLRDELGRTLEVRTIFSGWVNSSLAVFASSFRDLISTVRLPEGIRQFMNIGEARITGFEAEADKSFGHFYFGLQYTYLEAENKTDNRRLDLVPRSQVSLLASYLKPENFSLAFWLLGASEAEILISQSKVSVPSYATANLSLEKFLGSGSFFLKVENLFNKAYFTEPGYPLSCRRIEIGFSFRAGL